jgi:integrase
MATLNRLAPKRIANAPDGRFADGGGLYLRVRGEGKYRHWIFRFVKTGKVTEIGIGAVKDVPLAKAREEARRLRQMVASGANPLVERRRAEAEQANSKTFGEVAKLVIDRGRNGWTVSSLRGWTNSLIKDAKRLADMNIADIGIDDVRRTVMPQFDKGDHVAARRTLGRIASALDYATARGWRSGANVAVWSVFKHLAPARDKADRRHRMLPWQGAPDAIDNIRVAAGVAPRALEFMILTATRLSEATDAQWSEIDFEAKTWTIPVSRMKARQPHTVPLSKRALEILDELGRGKVGEYVFPGRNMYGPIGAKTVQLACDAATGEKASPHGFRATFRSWCGANGVVREVAEAALAHTVQGVEGSYLREPMLERRRPIMEAWATFLDGKGAGATVVPFKSKGKRDAKSLQSSLVATLKRGP